MPIGLSLHLGLNAIDPAHYGSPGTLAGCENDARSMALIARECGYVAQILLTSQATSASLLDFLHGAAVKLEIGDILLLTYAGHGSQVKDPQGDERDGLDETWVLFDRMLLDDELYAAWTKFQPGVRIVVVSDSCHSGTMLRVATIGSGHSAAHRSLPAAIAAMVVATHGHVYQPVFAARRKRAFPGSASADVHAGVILLAACQDHELAADGARNGLYTSKLLEAWTTSPEDYRAFHDTICDRMSGFSQRPNFEKVGVVEPAFETSRPFSIVREGAPRKDWAPIFGTL